MKRFLSVLIVLFAVSFMANSQNLVGLHKAEILKYMRENHPKLHLDDRTISSKNPALKYMDNAEERTLNFFLTDKNYCNYSKFIYDSSLFKEVMVDLIKKYKYEGKMRWIGQRDGKDYTITLEKSEWFITVLIKETKK